MAKQKRKTVAKPEDARSAFVEHAKKLREQKTLHLVDRARQIAELQRFMDRAGKQARRSIDPLDEVRDREWEIMLRDAPKQQSAAAKQLRRQRARQRQALRTIVDHRPRFEYKKGNPHTSICLWKSTKRANALLNPQTFNDGTVRLLFAPLAGNIRTGENAISLSAEVIGGQVHDFHFNPVAALDIITQHFFETTAPHDGVLSITGTYAPLGTVFLGAAGDLMFAPSAGGDMSIYLQVQVETLEGDLIDLPIGTTQTVFDREVGPSISGQSALVPVGSTHSLTYQLAHENLMEVHEGDTIRITAGFDLYIAGSLRGTARATFSPSPLAFNVPMVLVRVDG